MTLQIKYPTDILFAAAAYAVRINAGYLKINEYAPFDYQKGTGGELIKRTNKEVLLSALADQSLLTPDDLEQGRLTRQFCQGLIMRQLVHGNLSDYHKKLMECANEDEGRIADAGIVAYAPVMYSATAKREAITDRLQNADRDYVSTPGEKVKLMVEVIRSSYSQQYNCFFITAITEDNKAVFFSFKRGLELNQKYSIEGKVKAHKPDFQTQLNYVKI